MTADFAIFMGMSVATPADLADITSNVSKSGLRAGAYISAESTACAGPFDLPGHISSLTSILLTVWRTVLTCVVMSVAMLADIDDVPCHVSSHGMSASTPAGPLVTQIIFLLKSDGETALFFHLCCSALALLQFNIVAQIVELSLFMREILLLSSILNVQSSKED
ncbi:hypothetical protein Q3G72_026537 [Acer saccharum]|nr:hypothetical protein Q3G72_026537 [Acer saccharum]